MGFAGIGGVHWLQKSGFSQGSLWPQWEAGQNPLGISEVGYDPGHLTLDKGRLLGQEVAQNHSQETRTGLSKKVSAWLCVCEIPMVFCFCHARKIACSGKLFAVSSLSLFSFLKGRKSLFALIMGASRDISRRPGGVGGAGGGINFLCLGLEPSGGDVTPGLSSTGRVGLV